MPSSPTDSDSARITGKARQRRRTRAAIVAATQRLLAAGEAPSVTRIADEADVSRRTVYQYFTGVDQLVLDATVGTLSEAAVQDALAAVASGGTPEERVAAMARVLSDQSSETLDLGRSLLRLTLDKPAGDEGGPRRGYRRVRWIEEAVQPLRGSLDDERYERLVSGLAMVVGWEAHIVLEDIRGLDATQRTETSVWAARALINAAMSE